MSTLETPIRPDPGGTASERVGPPRLDRHELLLAALLLLVIPVVGLQSVWSADEGALLYQGAALLNGDGGVVDHPFPEADPEGVYFPFHLAVFAEDGGYLVLAKHTALTWTAGRLYAFGGYPAVIGLSVLGTIAAAIGTSRLAGAVEPRAARPALWLTGVASPLFISSYVAWGHTLAVAAIAWGVHLLVTAVRRGGSVMPVAAGAALVGASSLIRTEATLAGIAIALGFGAAAVVADERRWTWLRAAGATMLATAVGVALDRATALPDAGLVGPDSGNSAIWSLSARFEGFARTWLHAGYTRGPLDTLTLLAAVAIIAAGLMARRGPSRAPLVQVLLATGAAAIAARFVASPGILIPGLLVAFPLLFAGLANLERIDLRRPVIAAHLTAFVGLCLAVIATQYRYGGGGEWGGRYFAVGLPMGIAVATPAAVRRFDELVSRVDQADRRRFGRRLIALVAVPVVMLMTMGIVEMAAARGRSVDLRAAVQEAAVPAGDADDSPVIITTVNPLARWMWEDVDDGRWLLVPVEDLPTVMERLDRLGVHRLVLVTEDGDRAVDDIARWYEPLAADERVPDSSPASIVVPLRATGNVG